MTEFGDPQIPDRIWAKIVIHSDGCWVWTAATTRGYGHSSLNGQRGYVHRIMHTVFVGAIPDGFEVDHLCRNILCVRPDHLEAVTKAENMRRSASPNGSLYQHKQWCLRGHERTPDNLTYVRNCKTCVRILQAAKRTPKGPRTHCPAGHAYAETALYTGGRRFCGVCKNARKREARARLRETEGVEKP